jgi:UDP-3-O-[3-hydroxymyristoyl] N-acetylglucosamine deacetylase/3-hydroxyacyl-[acyl-carrier-protein] dehydratase
MPKNNGTEVTPPSMIKQTTIRQSITVSGVGLHTGEKRQTLTFKPAPSITATRFKRIDLPDQPVIEADVDHVIDTNRGTTIGKNGAKVSTVEHVLAALPEWKSTTC